MWERVEGERLTDRTGTLGDVSSENQTQSLRTFLRDEAQLIGLTEFVGYLVTRADETALTAAKALLEGARSDEERRQYEETIERGGAGVREQMQRQYAQAFTQMVYQRGVDNFLQYVSDLLRLIFVQRPEALRTSETIKVEEALRHQSMDELIVALTERRVERLAYLSINDLADDLEKSLGLCLFDNPDDVRMATRIVANRNVIAHNRATVNARYVRMVPDCNKNEGDSLALHAETFFTDMKFLHDAAVRIDGTAAEHFGLDHVDHAGNRRGSP